MQPVDTWEKNGYTVELHYDEDCESPRHFDGNFLILGREKRNGEHIGDEPMPEDDFTCPHCEGSGVSPHELEPTDCTRCGGDGSLSPNNLNELIELVKAQYKATVVVPVWIYEHSGIVLRAAPHNPFHDPWDSTLGGLILDTPEVWEVRGRPGRSDDNPETITEWMIEEVAEYSRWMGGENYGYVIKDANGDEIPDGSCWGFIGSEYARSEADAAVPDEPPPPILRSVRLTHDEARWIIGAMGDYPANDAGIPFDAWEALEAKFYELKEEFD